MTAETHPDYLRLMAMVVFFGLSIDEADVILRDADKDRRPYRINERLNAHLAGMYGFREAAD